MTLPTGLVGKQRERSAAVSAMIRGYFVSNAIHSRAVRAPIEMQPSPRYVASSSAWSSFVNRIGLAARQHRGQRSVTAFRTYVGRRQSRIVPRGMPRRREILQSLRPCSTRARAAARTCGRCMSAICVEKTRASVAHVTSVCRGCGDSRTDLALPADLHLVSGVWARALAPPAADV